MNNFDNVYWWDDALDIKVIICVKHFKNCDRRNIDIAENVNEIRRLLNEGLVSNHEVKTENITDTRAFYKEKAVPFVVNATSTGYVLYNTKEEKRTSYDEHDVDDMASVIIEECSSQIVKDIISIMENLFRKTYDCETITARGGWWTSSSPYKFKVQRHDEGWYGGLYYVGHDINDRVVMSLERKVIGKKLFCEVSKFRILNSNEMKPNRNALGVSALTPMFLTLEGLRDYWEKLLEGTFIRKAPAIEGDEQATDEPPLPPEEVVKDNLDEVIDNILDLVESYDKWVAIAMLEQAIEATKYDKRRKKKKTNNRLHTLFPPGFKEKVTPWDTDPFAIDD